VIDLHCHSTCSDGSDPPEALARLAAAAGLSAVALTDHDTVAGFEAFERACAERGVRAIRGAEISCLDEGRSTHVLCYFVSDRADSALRRLLARLAADRADRNVALIERLGELGYERITLAEVASGADATTASLGRPHVADALLRLYPEQFASRQAVFDELLGTRGRAYVQKAQVSVAEASAAAAEDGAVTVLAHPLVTLLSDLRPDERTLPALERRVEPVIARLAADGLSGVECWYSRHDALSTEALVELTRRHGLVATGGSDYHGAGKPDIALGTGTGSLRVPDEALAALEAVAGAPRPV